MKKLGDRCVDGIFRNRRGSRRRLRRPDIRRRVRRDQRRRQAPWIKGDDFAPVTDTVLVNLNCNAAVASATKSGNSAASPEGRAALKAATEDKSGQ
jgi:hypothetical protein